MVQSLEMSGDTEGWERLATNLRVEKALLQVLELLEGLPVVVFKGALLTRMVYGDLRQRASADNDLWIPHAYAHEALTRLLSAGYLPEPGLDARAAFRRRGQVPLWLAGDFTQVSADLHVEAFSALYFSVDESVLKEHLVSVEIHGRRVQTFDRLLAMTHMAAHFIQHQFEQHVLVVLGHAWDRWHKELDLDELFLLSSQTCTRSALEYSLWLAHLLGYARCEVPPLSSWRARALAQLHGDKLPAQRDIYRKFMSLAVSDLKNIPQGMLHSLWLEQDELNNRYGEGARGAQFLKHIAYLFRG